MSKVVSNDNGGSLTVREGPLPNIGIVMVTNDGNDVLGDALNVYSRYKTTKIFVLDTGFTSGHTAQEICSGYPSVAAFRHCRNLNRPHEEINQLLSLARQELCENDWLFLLGDDEILADDPRELAARAAAEGAASIVFDIADFYLTIGESASRQPEDFSTPIWERRLYYSIHSSAPKACLNLPALSANRISIFPRASAQGDPLLRMASFRPVLKHYHFRSPTQIRGCLSKDFSAILGCSGYRPSDGRWFEYLIDERLLLRFDGTWIRQGKSLNSLRAETATLSRRRLCAPTRNVNTNSGPLVSVIVPTYNRSRLLGSALRSLQAQTYKNLEIIIVDDGSTDDTASTVLNHPDDRITYVVRATNSGGWRSLVRNEGLRISSGDYICYLDDDNTWEPQHIHILVEVLESWPHVGMVYCDSVKHGPHRRQVSEDFDRDKLLRWNYIDTGEIMHRRECLETVGMWEPALRFGQDWEFCLRISEEYPVVHVPVVLSHWFSSPDSIVRTSGSEESLCYRLIRKAYQSRMSGAQRVCLFRGLPNTPRLGDKNGGESTGQDGAEEEPQVKWCQVSAGTDPEELVKDFEAKCIGEFSSSGPLAVLKAGPQLRSDMSPGGLASDTGDVYLEVDSEDTFSRLPTRKFGLVLASGLMERFKSPDRTLKALRRILKPGGILCLAVPFDASVVPLEDDLQRLTPGYVTRLLAESFAEVKVEVAGHPKSPMLFLCLARKRGGSGHPKIPPIEAVLWFHEDTLGLLEEWLRALNGTLQGHTTITLAVEGLDPGKSAILSRNRSRFQRAVVGSKQAGIQLLRQAIASVSSAVFALITVEAGRPSFPRGWPKRCLAAFAADLELGWIGGGTVKGGRAVLTDCGDRNKYGHPIVQLVRRKALNMDDLTSVSLESMVESRRFKTKSIAEILHPPTG